MVGTLLLRGMLVGVCAGILCFGFLKIVGEPPVDRAIAFESAMDKAHEHAEADASKAHDSAQDHHHHMHGMPDADANPADASPHPEPEPELVSRSVQAGIGLFTGVGIYSASIGGLFALAFAFAYGRIGPDSPRALSALLALTAFISLSLVPFLKYPANPPSVGAGETIGSRTALYFAMIAISLAAMIGCAILRKGLLPRFGTWNASLLAGAAYLCIVVAAGLSLPTFDEVPEHFPAGVLWQFRLAALGAQTLMWVTIGLVFGALTEGAANKEIVLRHKTFEPHES